MSLKCAGSSNGTPN